MSPPAAADGPTWYHTIDLPDGSCTPGLFDHRAATGYVAWPAAVAGGRCLDVGTFDGFWSFELERRGASEVVAIDVDDLPLHPAAALLDPIAVAAAGDDYELLIALPDARVAPARAALERACPGLALTRIGNATDASHGVQFSRAGVRAEAGSGFLHT